MKTYRNILICFCLGIAFVSTLVLISASSTKEHSGGFERLFAEHKVLIPRYTQDLQFNSYYLAGMDSSNVYLANSTDANHLIIADSTLSIKHVSLKIPDSTKIAWKVLRVQIEFPTVFLKDGVSPAILQGRFPDLTYQKNSFSLFFTELTVADENQFYFRAYNELRKQNILLKSGPQTGEVQTYRLEKQVDGFFCTDGMLLYNGKRKEALYVYYYRNQCVRLDSRLHLKSKVQTIDTISRANVEVGTINSEEKMVLTNDPIVVNKLSSVDADFLYIHSGVKADNEMSGDAANNSVMDVYDLRTNAYRYSFYLPKVEDKDLDDFKVNAGRLIAINDHMLTVYELPGDLTSGSIQKQMTVNQ